MQGIQLKSTCDSCVASKVKCSGTQPCSRCALKGFDCFYRPRKKRSRVKKTNPPAFSSSGVMISNVSNQPIQSQSISNNSSLLLSENLVQRPIRSDSHLLKSQTRRSWTVFFILYKNYNASCSRFWFDQQLAKIHRYLTKTNSQENLKQLNAWMESVDIDYESLNDVNSPCMMAIRNNQNLLKQITEYKAPHFHINGNLHVCSDVVVRHGQDETISCTSKEKEFLGLDTVHSYIIEYKSGMDDGDVTVRVSPNFAELFGISGDEITKDVKEFGILPYGVDVFANIMSEDDLLALIQILVIKTNSFKCSMSLGSSIVRQIPSCHVFDLKTAKSYKPIPFMIKMVHHQSINIKKGIFLDFTAVLEPMQELPVNEVQIISDSFSNSLFLSNGSSIDSDISGTSTSASSLSSISSPKLMGTTSSFLPVVNPSGEKKTSNGLGSPFSGSQDSSPPNSIGLLRSSPDAVEFDAISGFEFDEKDIVDPDLTDEFWLDDMLKWARGPDGVNL